MKISQWSGLKRVKSSDTSSLQGCGSNTCTCTFLFIKIIFREKKSILKLVNNDISCGEEIKLSTFETSLNINLLSYISPTDCPTKFFANIQLNIYSSLVSVMSFYKLVNMDPFSSFTHLSESASSSEIDLLSNFYLEKKKNLYH